MKELILRGKNLRKSFGKTAVMDGVDIDIYAGDFTVIIGPSGAGKSTLLYCLSGMDTLTGGEAQRAAIARAMINRPALIFADEPTGALNKSNSQEVMNLLTGLNAQGQSILMVTHDTRAALRGNRLLYLEDGKIMDELALPDYHPHDEQAREREITGRLSKMRW